MPEKTDLYFLAILSIVAIVGIVVMLVDGKDMEDVLSSISLGTDHVGFAMESAETANTCTDTDSGFDYTTKGTISGGVWKTTGKTYSDKTDSCNARGQLQEGFCYDLTYGFYVFKYCDKIVGEGYICYDGACVLDSDSDTVPDSLDVCDGEDDMIDSDSDGTPDCAIVPDTSSITVTKTVTDDCPDGFLLDEDALSPITGEYLCKPIVMEMVASDDLDNYLIDEITGVEILWNDWSTYEPLLEKVKELTVDLETDQEKVEAIANWVYTSKDYSCDKIPPPEGDDCLDTSQANNDADFTEIWESEEGVCLDAAIITTAMFRVAGIPAIEKMVAMNHIVTLYNIEDSWFQIDTTYCNEDNKEDCKELEFKEVDDVEDNIYTLYNRLGHFETDDGEYCEYDFCLESPFQTNKIMPLNNQENGATVYYPAIRNMETSSDEQIYCSLEFKAFTCDADHGCFISATYAGTWNTDIFFQYEIEDIRNIGYNKIMLPAYTSNEEYIEEVGDKIRHYRFACKEQTDYRLIAYKEFTLDPGDEMIITYDDLEEWEDAEEGEFDEVVTEIKEVTENIGISLSYS